MRLLLGSLTVAVCVHAALPAQAAGCEGYFSAARNAAFNAESYEAQAAGDRQAMLSGDTLRQPDTGYACVDLGRLYRTTQDAMNAYNKARLNFDRAVGACAPEYTIDLNDRVRLAQKKSDAMRGELSSLTRIGSDIRCTLR